MKRNSRTGANKRNGGPRNRLCLLCLLLCNLVHPTLAQIWMQTGTPATNWGAVAVSADGTRLIAGVGGVTGLYIGPAGPVYTSSDSGMTWTLTGLPIENWRSVACSADGTKLAASSGSALYISTNSGMIWNLASLPPDAKPSSAVWSADGNKAVVAGGSTGVYASTNGGASWLMTSTNGPTAIACSANGLRLVGVESSSITTSTDFGASWTAANVPANGEPFVGVASSADGSTLVAITGFASFISTNGGATWNKTNAPNWYSTSVASSADGTRLVVAGFDWVHSWDTNPLYTSIDAGTSWQTGSARGHWTSVALSADGSKLFAADTSAIWTAQSISVPLLSLIHSNGLAILSWIMPSSHFVLQQTSDLTRVNWSDVTNAPTLNLTNLRYEVAASQSDAIHFYRLKR